MRVLGTVLVSLQMNSDITIELRNGSIYLFIDLFMRVSLFLFDHVYYLKFMIIASRLYLRFTVLIYPILLGGGLNSYQIFKMGYWVGRRLW